MIDIQGQSTVSPPRLPADLPNRLRLPLTFDPAMLEADLRRLESTDWTPHFVPQHFDGDWSVVPLRAPQGATHPILRIAVNPGVTDWEDTEFLEMCPYFRQVIDSFDCRIDAARLMRLTPGSIIKEHSDHDLAAEWGNARLHIPVTTNPDVDFRLGGRRVTMAPGSVWYLRLADLHSVTNGGSTDRVHLVIDARMNDWLAAMLADAAANPDLPAEEGLSIRDDCKMPIASIHSQNRNQGI